MIWIALILGVLCLLALFVAPLFCEENDGKIVARTFSTIGIVVALVMFFFCSINVVRPGYVGVQTTFGTISPRPLTNGFHFINPFSHVEAVEVRTFEYTMSSSTNEGAVTTR